MNLRALMGLGLTGLGLMGVGLAALSPPPASAQPAPATTQATFDGVLAAGYEIKAVTVLSDTASKEVFGQAVTASQIFITLQKGTSVAVCENATSTWLSLADAQMTDATRCYKR
jgi:hypothetical protein